MNLTLESVGTVVLWVMAATGVWKWIDWAWDGVKAQQARADKMREMEELERKVGP